MKVTILGIVDGTHCWDCDLVDGVYILNWNQFRKGGDPVEFCDGSIAQSYCLWVNDCRESAGYCPPGIRVLESEVFLYIAVVGDYYYVEVWLVLNLGGPVKILKWLNRYPIKPDCKNFENEVMGTYDTCSKGWAEPFRYCEIGDYSSVLLTALEACKGDICDLPLVDCVHCEGGTAPPNLIVAFDGIIESAWTCPDGAICSQFNRHFLLENEGAGYHGCVYYTRVEFCHATTVPSPALDVIRAWIGIGAGGNYFLTVTLGVHRNRYQHIFTKDLGAGKPNCFSWDELDIPYSHCFDGILGVPCVTPPGWFCDATSAICKVTSG